MITIKHMNVNKPFKYLWLKKVEDIDLSVHCAKCLVGQYIDAINTKQKAYTDIELQDGIYYLCGVALPYKWDNNFHLAFKYSKGSQITYDSNGISVVIQDAIQLPIDEKYIDTNNAKARFKTYRTCRNWQFAHYLNTLNKV